MGERGWRNVRAVAPLVALAVLAAGCRSDAPGADTTASTAITSQASTAGTPTTGGITASGAAQEVPLAGGGSVVLPAGALPAGTTVTTAPATVTDAAPVGMTPAGAPVEIATSAPLAAPAVLRFPADPPAGDVHPVIATFSNGVWTPVVSTWDEPTGTVQATTDHFSIWAPFRWDIGKIVDKAAEAVFGVVDTSALTCPETNLDPWRFLLDGEGDALSACARLDGDRIVITLKNRRSASFSVEYRPTWTADVPGREAWTTLTESLFNVTSRRFLVIPGGETAILSGTLAPDDRVVMPVTQDMATWTADGFVLAFAILAGIKGSPVLERGVDRTVELKGGFDCLFKVSGFAEAVQQPGTGQDAAEKFLPAIWTCAAGELGKFVSFVLTPFTMVWRLGELGKDIVTGDSNRELTVWRIDSELAPPPAAPTTPPPVETGAPCRAGSITGGMPADWVERFSRMDVLELVCAGRWVYVAWSTPGIDAVRRAVANVDTDEVFPAMGVVGLARGCLLNWIRDETVVDRLVSLAGLPNEACPT